ncbi:unnamed protein product, partial [Choristocarpus tenellus]
MVDLKQGNKGLSEDVDALQYGASIGGLGSSSVDNFFSSDTRVVFGVNALEIGLVELDEIGFRRPLIVTGWNQARADPLVWELLPRDFDLGWHSVKAEPSLADVVAAGADVALEHRCDCVIGVGGASVLDAAKVIAAIAYSAKDHLHAARRLLGAAGEPRCKGALSPEGTREEVDGDEEPVLGPVPFVAVPLVAGVGAEVTPMASIILDEDALIPAKV